MRDVSYEVLFCYHETTMPPQLRLDVYDVLVLKLPQHREGMGNYLLAFWARFEENKMKVVSFDDSPRKGTSTAQN
jgi:hypothetical protein